MPTTSGSTGNPLGAKSTSLGKGGRYPIVVEVPLISKHPKPDASWESPEKAKCPGCQEEVWTHAAIRRAQAEPNMVAFCPNCTQAEKERQSGS